MITGMLVNATCYADSQQVDVPPNYPITVAPQCSSQSGFDLWADFLYWSANFNLPTGLFVGISQESVNNDRFEFFENTITSRLKRPQATWDPGVRVGLGWNTGYDNWDVQGYWTYFYNSTRLKQNQININNVSGWNRGHSKLRLRYNAADVELGKAYHVSRNFFIRPFTGIHGVWLDQQDDSRFSGNIEPISGLDQPLKTRLNINSWGVGPRFGINTNWGDFNGFSLLGNLSTSLVYGKTLTMIDVNLDLINNPADPIVVSDTKVNVRDRKYWQLMPTLQMILGASWKHCFYDNKCLFQVNAGWEANFLWESANIIVIEKALSMQGLTLDFRFDF
jgi:hypothetical protein